MDCPVDRSCRYSFDDLFVAAFGEAMSDARRRELYALSQDRRNVTVREWVGRTAGRFACEDRRGTDGVIYTAFWESVPH